MTKPHSVLVPQAAVLPPKLHNASRWLVWKLAQKQGDPKPKKLPIYVGGGLRGRGFGLDTPDDVSRLSPFNDACQRLADGRGEFAGIGYALVAGDGVGGIDLDNCLDENGVFTNGIAKQVYDCAVAGGAYAEVGPSGKGLRIIGSTRGFENFTRKGYEAYCKKRFLTITGNCLANAKGFGAIDAAVRLMDQLVPAPSAPPTTRNVMGSTLVANVAGGVYVKPDRVMTGGRNDAVLKYASHLRGSGVAEHILLEAVSDFNKVVCVPPLDDEEVAQYCQSIPTSRSHRLNPQTGPSRRRSRRRCQLFRHFDARMLPAAFQAYVEDTAELMQAPLDYVAVPLMVAAAATIGNSLAIAPKVWDTNWLVTPVLWGGIVGRPGMKKSPAMDKGVVHLKALEDDMDAAHQLNVQKHATDKIIYDAVFASAKAAAKAGRPVPVLPPEPKSPGPERLVINDSTYQKLTDILQWSPRGCWS